MRWTGKKQRTNTTTTAINIRATFRRDWIWFAQWLFVLVKCLREGLLLSDQWYIEDEEDEEEEEKSKK